MRTPDRDFGIVRSFLPCDKHRAKTADAFVAEAGLQDRLAIVLYSFRPGKVDMFFDHELFLNILTTVTGFLRSDAMAIELEDKSTLAALDELRVFYEELDEDDRVPPERITWTRQNRLLCVGVCQNWHLVGGPDPYHDSFTFELFGPTRFPDDLLASIEKGSAALGANVVCRLEGARDPT